MYGQQTLPPKPLPSSGLQFRPLGPLIRAPDLFRPQPVDIPYFLGYSAPITFRAYKKGGFHDPGAGSHTNFLRGMGRDDFKLYMVGHLNFAAFDGLKRYHDSIFQNRVDQRCLALAAKMRPMSCAEAGHGIKEAPQRCQELRISVIVLMLHARVTF